MTIETERASYAFTIPGNGEPMTIGSTPNVSSQVHLFSDGSVRIELGDFVRNGLTVTLSMEQFQQLRAKIIEVTGRVA